MERGAKIAVGVGCGCFGLLVLAGGGGAAMYFMTSGGSESTPWVDGLPPTPTPVMPAIPAPTPVSGEPRDDAFAAYVNGAATAVHAAIRGLPHDARWNGVDPASDLRATTPATRAELAPLGADPQLVFTVVELEATDGAMRVRSNVAVFPDGRVRWTQAARDSTPTTAPAGLAMAAPAVAAEATRMLETLGGACDLPVVAATDVALLPADAQSEILRDIAELPQACAPGASAIGWQPKVDDVTVVMSGNGRFALVRTQLEIEGATLRLTAPSVRLP